MSAEQLDDDELPHVDATIEAGEPQPTNEWSNSTAEPGLAIDDRYVLAKKIGEGGMGEVWIAKQSSPVQRRVAIKLIRAGMDSNGVLKRFEQERQSLAIMEHPNIAQVFDAGLTPGGHPYFVMELVSGPPLDEFCDGAKLSLRERIDLFQPICQAVQHAHHKGIVHRDLKPANILVATIDGKPVPKIIDFGLAKAVGGATLSQETMTQIGAVVGTLEYMSPEQADFTGDDIDTRSDIYSLGVVLYELLTGLRPIDKRRIGKAALTEMVRIIREEEPSKPSRRLSMDDALATVAALRQTHPSKLMLLLRGELDWVVMKCLAKERERRYETANGLLRDLQRYLVDEPVEARPPSNSYRLRKFLKRNKGSIVAASLLFFSLLAGITGTTVGFFEANRQANHAMQKADEAQIHRDEARSQRDFANQQRASAEQNLELAEKQAKLALETIQFVVTDIDGQLREQPSMQHIRLSLLHTVSNRLDRLDAELAGGIQGEAIPTFMAVRHQIATTYTNLGQLEDAAAEFEKLESMARARMAIKGRNDATRSTLATVLFGASIVSHRLGDDPAVASELLEETLALCEEIVNDPLPTRDSQTNDRTLYFLSISAQNLGGEYLREGRILEAERTFVRAFRTSSTVLKNIQESQEFEELSEAQKDARIGRLLGILDKIKLAFAYVKLRLGKTNESLELYEAAIANCRELYDRRPNALNMQSELAGALKLYAKSLFWLGRLAEAHPPLQESIKLFEQAILADPENADLKRALASSLYLKATLRKSQDRATESSNLFEQSRLLFEELFQLSASRRNQTSLMLAEAAVGNKQEALRHIVELGQTAERNAGLHLDRARALGILVDQALHNREPTNELKERGLDALERSVDEGYSDPFRIRTERELAPLRDSDRYRKILSKLAA